jgi:drug/metabolite transporter (DMT)-like permease
MKSILDGKQREGVDVALIGRGGSRKRLVLTTGILLGLGAGLLWGFVFVAPQLLPSFGSVEVALGRYFFYGVFSAGLLLALGLRRSSREDLQRTGKKGWLVALAFAFSGNVGYYLLLVLGIRFASAPVATLLVGTIPVTVALAGNLVEREFLWRRLAVPVALILPGLLAINLAGAGGGVREGEGTFFGLLCTLGAVGLWTLYGVANARFLRTNPSISGSVWSTMVGAATLVLVALVVPLVVLLDPGAIEFRQLLSSDSRLAWFVAASAFLGVVVSWGGTLLWNGASARLPTSLAGQLIVSETVAGLLYVFVADARVPSVFELAGILAVVSGVLVGIRRTRTPSREVEEATWSAADEFAPGGNSKRGRGRDPALRVGVVPSGD